MSRGPLRRVALTEAGRPRLPWRLTVGAIVLPLAAQLGGLFWEGLGSLGGPGRLGAALVALGWVALYGVPAAAIIGLSVLIDRRTLAALGVAARPRRLAVGLAVGVAMATAVVAPLLGAGLASVDGTLVTSAENDFGVPAGAGALAGVAAGVVVALAVGTGEELFVRGYLLANLGEALAGFERVGEAAAAWVAVLLTAALFGVLHAANPSATPLSTATIAVVGVVFGWTVLASGDLALAVGLHAGWNAAVGSLYGLPVSGLRTPATVLDVALAGPPRVTGGSFGPEAGLVMGLALVVGVGLVWAWLAGVEGLDPRRAGLPGRRPGDAGNRDG